MAPEDHHEFKTTLAASSKMGSTSPMQDRETNAKRTYVQAPMDERSPWSLFHDATRLGQRAGAPLVSKGDRITRPVPLEESMARLDKDTLLPTLALAVCTGVH